MDFDDIFDIKDEALFRIEFEKFTRAIYGNGMEIQARIKGIRLLTDLNEELAESCYRHAIFLIKDNAYDGTDIDIIRSIAMKNAGEINMGQAIEIYRYLIDPDNCNFYDDSLVPENTSTSKPLGLSRSHPAMVPGIKFSYIYLNCIQTSTGEQITYQRKKSISSSLHDKPIDLYEIKTVDGRKLDDIIIYPYSNYLSPIPPGGYKWISFMPSFLNL